MSPVEGQVMQVPLGAVSPIRLLIVLLSALSVFSSPASAGPVGRERLSINEGWRFLKGEPAGSGSGLDYDVRPKVAQSADGKAADARPDEAAQVDRAGHQLLKPWILPTGNAFIRDPAKKYSRPAGNPGGEHPYVQASLTIAVGSVSLCRTIGLSRALFFRKDPMAEWVVCRAGVSAGIAAS
jgi:hypothetical protein